MRDSLGQQAQREGELNRDLLRLPEMLKLRPESSQGLDLVVESQAWWVESSDVVDLKEVAFNPVICFNSCTTTYLHRTLLILFTVGQYLSVSIK